MKLIRIFLIFVVVSFIFGVGSAFNGNSLNQTSDNTNNDTNYSPQAEKSYPQESLLVEEKNENKNVETEEKTNNQQQNEKKNEKEVPTDPEKIIPPKQETKPQENTQVKDETIITNPPKEDHIVSPWEDLGITEYDYYHKPMWKWARVDFSIEKYGSEENTRNACIQAGNESKKGFSCSTINSYSGNYLGEMLETF